MALKTTSIQGTRDVLPGESAKWQYLRKIALETARLYGVEELMIPTIEKTELFTRSVGETTDVVQKEMYTFEKGKNSITLRPEGTAGTVRAAIQNSLLDGPLPVKVCYNVSCFRHERPQSGRLREFHQFGVEMFGCALPAADAELIQLVHHLLGRLGILEGIRLEINSIGCRRCRPGYNRALVEYFSGYREQLCPACLERLEKNPMRLLDCKVESCRNIAKNAPKILDYLCPDCTSHFEALKALLDAVKIGYIVNPRIVRGLDYYTNTVFEFTTTQIGAQGTVCGGGRYDLLVEQMGGAPTPALGFALGIERLIMVMEAMGAVFPPEKECDLYLGSIGGPAGIRAFELASRLRAEGFYVLCDTVGRSVKSQMKYADKIGARFSCILGDNELGTGKAELKNMRTGQSSFVSLELDEKNETSLLKKLYDAGIDEAVSRIEDARL